jgi:hypothetical protein
LKSRGHKIVGGGWLTSCAIPNTEIAPKTRKWRMTDPSHSNCFSYFEKGNLSIAYYCQQQKHSLHSNSIP